jgi:hypothetical protein
MGCAASISAVTKPVKSPTVERPSRMRQPIRISTPPAAMPAPISSSGSRRARAFAAFIRSLRTSSKAPRARALR